MIIKIEKFILWDLELHLRIKNDPVSATCATLVLSAIGGLISVWTIIINLAF